MRRVREILRYRFEQGLGHKAISVRVGAAPSTVRETLRSASAAGLFSLLESGRCDMIEPVTNLPARALRGDFTPIPAFHAPVYVDPEAEFDGTKAGGSERVEHPLRHAPGHLAARRGAAYLPEGAVRLLPLGDGRHQRGRVGPRRRHRAVLVKHRAGAGCRSAHQAAADRRPLSRKRQLLHAPGRGASRYSVTNASMRSLKS